jgi:hypothetical protein
MSVPGTRKAWAEMPTGRRRWATGAPDRHLQRPDRTPGSRRPPPRSPAPEHRSFRCVLVPLPVPAGSSCDFRWNLSGGLR